MTAKKQMTTGVGRRARTILQAALLALWAQSAAQALVIDAVADTWIRESAPSTAYSNDLISVWDGTTNDQRRYGVVMFDLSSTIGETIESVYLNLYDRGDSAGLEQQATLLTATPPTFPANFESYTWDEFATFDEGQNESALASLGAYNIEGGDAISGYQESDFATSGDISLLEQTRDAQSGAQDNLVVFILKAVAGQRDWGDIDVSGFAPQLVINQMPSEPGDFDDSGAVTIADYQIMIDPANWLQEVPPGTMGGRGDLTGNGVVDLDDFNAFKPIFAAANPGVALSVQVPEPTTLVIGALCAIGIGAAGGRRRRRPADHRGEASRLPARSRLLAVALCGLATVFCTSTRVDAVTLEATTEFWLRESSPDAAPFESDLISVWNSFGNDGARRYGVVEFDLSSLEGVDVTFAGLQLWDAANGFSDDSKAIKQSAVVIDTTGGTPVAGLTWNILQSEYAASSTALEGLGLYDLPEQTSPEDFQNSVGSAADQALIESIAANTSGSQLLTLILIADESDEVEYSHSWGDGPDGYGGMNPQLVINEPFPEDVQLRLEVDAVSGSMWIANPGVDPREDTMFEIDGYVIQSPADDGLDPLNPAGFTGLTGAGESDWDIVAPTANALTELSLTSSVTLAEGDVFALGTGYVAGADEDPGLTFQYSVAGGETVFGDVVYVTPDGVDVDNDGDVDGADFLGIQRNSPAQIAAWQAAYGTSQAAAGAVVPEPGVAWLLASGLLASFGARRRR